MGTGLFSGLQDAHCPAEHFNLMITLSCRGCCRAAPRSGSTPCRCALASRTAPVSFSCAAPLASAPLPTSPPVACSACRSDPALGPSCPLGGRPASCGLSVEATASTAMSLLRRRSADSSCSLLLRRGFSWISCRFPASVSTTATRRTGLFDRARLSEPRAIRNWKPSKQ